MFSSSSSSPCLPPHPTQIFLTHPHPHPQLTHLQRRLVRQRAARRRLPVAAHTAPHLGQRPPHSLLTAGLLGGRVKCVCACV